MIVEDILDILDVLEDVIDTRKWLPIFYGNRFGFLPYRTEEEKQKLLNDKRFYEYNGKSSTVAELMKEDDNKKKGFKLEL